MANAKLFHYYTGRLLKASTALGHILFNFSGETWIIATISGRHAIRHDAAKAPWKRDVGRSINPQDKRRLNNSGDTNGGRF